MSRADLRNAQRAKQDEFYTQLTDIEKELKYYRQHFKNKIVLCNCDDPYESNFFQYFAKNFNFLGLKKLICTCYKNSSISYSKKRNFKNKKATPKLPYKIEITEVKDFNKNGAIDDIADVDYLLENDQNSLTVLKGDGDFRSEECIELLKQSDVVVTNPPFLYSGEYIYILDKYKKKFLIIGNQNAITYRETFSLIKENKMWLGASIHSGDREFRVPDSYEIRTKNMRKDQEGNRYVRVVGVRWFTNLDYKQRHEDLILYKKYSPEEYPKFDNYNAINVNKSSEIPRNYNGVIGVPITYLDKHNPDQFKILGLGTSRQHFKPNKIYKDAYKHLPNGKTSSGQSVNSVLTICSKTLPKEVYYTAKGVKGYLIAPYARILIQRIK